jgi:hypothetical protein
LEHLKEAVKKSEGEIKKDKTKSMSVTKTRFEYSEHPNTGLVWKFNDLKRSGSGMVQILNAIAIPKPNTFVCFLIVPLDRTILYTK